MEENFNLMQNISHNLLFIADKNKYGIRRYKAFERLRIHVMIGSLVSKDMRLTI